MSRRRNRPNPLNEGSLKPIYEWFFKPIIKEFLVEDEDPHNFLERMFGSELRQITQWKVVKHFKMPGLFYQSANLRTPGMGHRRIKLNTILMARIDERDTTVDVEFYGGKGGREQVFCLTKLEWEWVLLHLKPEIYDENKPRHRNRVRLGRPRKVRRLDQDSEQEGPGEEGAL